LVKDTRHDASVLNAEIPSDEANRLLVDLEAGNARLERINMLDYEVEERLSGYTVMIIGSVAHRINDDPQEFDGWFIGEEYHGGPHPILLLSPDRVFAKGTAPRTPIF